jgi:hypothetical protein
VTGLAPTLRAFGSIKKRNSEYLAQRRRYEKNQEITIVFLGVFAAWREN